MKKAALKAVFAMLGMAMSTPGAAAGLSCGAYQFPYCKGPARQFDASFKPGVGFGGFGGAKDCKPLRTPVVFIHGNADSAIGWDSEVATVAGFPKPAASVYDSFIAHGYQPCELFGLTYLTAQEQGAPQNNFHQPSKYALIKRFIDKVKAYTGSQQVDVVAHSLGVSMSLATLSYYDAQASTSRSWQSVRRFVNIAGAIRGLGACQLTGPANPIAPTCASEELGNRWVFGFYPDNAFVLFGFNEWTGADGRFSMREAPARHPDVLFYTLTAGVHDQIHCSTVHGFEECERGPLFKPAANVRAQLDVGAGATAAQVDLNFKDKSGFVSAAGDIDGVGHFKARNQTGEMLVRMLTSDCVGLDCKGGYLSGPVKLAPQAAD